MHERHLVSKLRQPTNIPNPQPPTRASGSSFGSKSSKDLGTHGAGPGASHSFAATTTSATTPTAGAARTQVRGEDGALLKRRRVRKNVQHRLQGFHDVTLPSKQGRRPHTTHTNPPWSLPVRRSRQRHRELATLAPVQDPRARTRPTMKPSKVGGPAPRARAASSISARCRGVGTVDDAKERSMTTAAMAGHRLDHTSLGTPSGT